MIAVFYSYWIGVGVGVAPVEETIEDCRFIAQARGRGISGGRMGRVEDFDSAECNGSAHERKQRWILVTGGAGYIGTHTVLQLLLEGYCVMIIDNLVNSCEEAVNRVLKLAGEAGWNLEFCKVCFYWHKLLHSHGL